MVKSQPSGAGDRVQLPDQGTRIPHAMGQLSPRRSRKHTEATTRESLCAAMEAQCSQKKPKVSGVPRQRNPALEIPVHEGGCFQSLSL